MLATTILSPYLPVFFSTLIFIIHFCCHLSIYCWQEKGVHLERFVWRFLGAVFLSFPGGNIYVHTRQFER